MKNKTPRNRQNGGFTLIENMISMAILLVIASIVSISYKGYIESSKNSVAVQQLRSLAFVINSYGADSGSFPNSLADIGNDNLTDPWGNLYEYLRIATSRGLGKIRKDHNLVPLNTNFDLYSKGKDGDSLSPLTAKASQDDIIYAKDGGYIGLGKDY